MYLTTRAAIRLRTILLPADAVGQLPARLPNETTGVTKR